MTADPHQQPPVRIALIGAGAVGCVLAFYLQQAGRSQPFLLAREKDRPQWQPLPALQLQDAQGLHRQARPSLCREAELAQMDYLLLCVKQTQLDAALNALPPLPPGCTLVSTLNGPSSLPRIRARLPQVRLLAMPVMFNSQLLAPLHVQLSTTPRVLIPREETRLRQAFAGSGLRVGSSHGEPSLWGKLMINLANAIGALTHTGFAELLTQRELRQAYVRLLDEAVAIFAASGTRYALPMPLPFALYRGLLSGRSPLPWWFARLRNGLRAGSYPSMVADLAQGRDTEVRELNGAIVQLAQTLGQDAPANRRICELVEARRGQVPPVYLSPAQLLQELAASCSQVSR